MRSAAKSDIQAELLSRLPTEMLERRAATVERMIHECRDPKSLPHLNELFQRIIDELARRDMEQHP